MKKIGLVLVSLFALTLAGCGDPSKDDICGECSDGLKDICEATYDACEELSECDLSDLEESDPCG